MKSLIAWVTTLTPDSTPSTISPPNIELNASCSDPPPERTSKNFDMPLPTSSNMAIKSTPSVVKTLKARLNGFVSARSQEPISYRGPTACPIPLPLTFKPESQVVTLENTPRAALKTRSMLVTAVVNHPSIADDVSADTPKNPRILSVKISISARIVSKTPTPLLRSMFQTAVMLFLRFPNIVHALENAVKMDSIVSNIAARTVPSS